ncbi:shikimate dehydrogenase [Feifania hominis]|uniref:Multifunctional fusion protein n=1 Tax=Feifania hominis TaxID=2763660 RepID=A0A926HTK9_9FIRM|nr:shikimate dehydrogenase [Feifania hominis]MBC8535413.1 shikimate dehydrogenase [Feifania hominis]
MTFEQFLQYRPTRRTFALFGHPVEHSVSPELHTFLLGRAGIDADYIAIDVPPESLGAAVARAREILSGFNVTIPHKQAILPLLDGCDDRVRALGACNTVRVEAGRLTGYNTDFDGFARALERDYDPAGKSALLLGAGGVAQVIARVLHAQGARLCVAARRPEQAHALAEACGAHSTGFDSLPSASFSLVVNATPVGMSPAENGLPAALPDGVQYVFDTIYNPPLTRLLREARSCGARGQNGLAMLVIQGAAAEDIWLDTHTPEPILLDAERLLLARLAQKRLLQIHGRRNIALSGFMGCGKSTVGRALADALGFDFVDADVEIERVHGPISEIFRTQGEPAFRRLESACLTQLAGRERTVIALGGGAMVFPQNFELLRERCLVCWLDVPVEFCHRNLIGDTTRPLLRHEDLLGGISMLYRQRRTHYERNCHLALRADAPVEQVVRALLSEI